MALGDFGSALFCVGSTKKALCVTVALKILTCHRILQHNKLENIVVMSTRTNTPPPENELPKLDPLPSLSMPAIQPSNAESSTSPPPVPAPSTHRRRRHTINRPDAASALLTESDEGETDDQTLDRISGILSNLIQEANEAVQNNGSTTNRRRSATSTLMKDRRRHSMYSPSQPVDSVIPCRSKSISRLPRPTRQQQYNYTWFHDHLSNGSSSSSISPTPLFSPTPIIESPTTSSSVEQQQYQHQQEHDSEYMEYQDTQTDREDEDGISDRQTINSASPVDNLENPDTDQQTDSDDGFTDDETQQARDNDELQQQEISHVSTKRRHTLPRSDPLIESLRRLDTSMALVESLSRDLAEEMRQPHQDDEEEEEEEEEKEEEIETAATVTATAAKDSVRPTSFISSTSTSKLTLLLLPLLHIPHALITTVFDTLATPGSTNTTTWNFSSPSPSSSSSFVNHTSSSSSSPSSLSGMIAWTFFFALANMVISWSGVTAPHDFIQQQKQQQRLASSPLPRQTLSDQQPRMNLAVRPRRLSLPGSYRSVNNNSTDENPAKVIMDISKAIINNNNSNNNNSNSDTNSNRMVRFKRPAPINTTLCVKKSSSSTYSVRRTTTTTTTTIKRSMSKKRMDNNNNNNNKNKNNNRNEHHQHQQKQQQLRQLQQLQKQVQQARRLSSTYMDASKNSNDTSFTLAIQRSRIWKQQQHLRHQRLRRPDYLLKKPDPVNSKLSLPPPPPPPPRQQQQHHDPFRTLHRRYSF
ncbi:hypothetical protein BCR42DRAFT_455249 [Absidia repens]|uniref:Uncharacterized protein n=1 Tax=Absidia repens TaxID=90262 RepID=A0A1X2I3X7_9FUNG|nr:hypothetical protein BCR42DRAFT_455249 [Absidia repens]